MFDALEMEGNISKIPERYAALQALIQAMTIRNIPGRKCVFTRVSKFSRGGRVNPKRVSRGRIVGCGKPLELQLALITESPFMHASRPTSCAPAFASLLHYHSQPPDISDSPNHRVSTRRKVNMLALQI